MAEVDQTRRRAWEMGVFMVKKADQAQDAEQALQCLAAATECFSAVLRRKSNDHPLQTA